MSYPATMNKYKTPMMGAGGNYIVPFNYSIPRRIKRFTSRTSREPLYLKQIDDHLSFKKQQSFNIFLDSGYYDIRVRFPKIEVIEKTREQAKVALREEFRYIWDEFAKEDDCNLTDGAKKIKYWALSNIEEV